MFFTTDELNRVFRAEVHDPLEGMDDGPDDSENLWRDWEVYEYMTEAVEAWAKATEAQYKILELPVVAGQRTVSLPGWVLDIRSAVLASNERELDPRNTNDSQAIRFDYGLQVYSALFSDATGVPQCYVRDYKRGALLLAPIPVVDDTLNVQCTMSLSVPMLPGMILPRMDMEDRRIVLHYMKYLAYAKQDADTLDLVRSETFHNKFKDESLDRQCALRKHRRTPGVVRMEW